ncbi:hypothetical protein C9933_01245 [Methylophaga nitratireducenticrescens]|uniref:Uncharacterized protein n=2 Tax=Pseudidiomarina aestuarii TaxID=624146 RepID=A0A2T4D9G5_9GAMM|nr:hypothetical protein C9933_01245 [Methylophaga nitratireducenticrescens]PTB84992.1 hypothetical protein C9988_03030 [Pseudidiomarina aestuarii]PTB86163.1 hypothetical protein C9940_03565 [Pseudidiomarina aestuarii]PTB89517.1 hypothetical protein C9928_03370 [Pseudidiomarina aestuarii]PTB90430.1 hypothetical protein C9927_00250 [Pseudidiomarina aestuarii]
MKAVVGVVVALMLAVGIYISLTGDSAQPTAVVSPETQPSSPTSTVEQVTESPAAEIESSETAVASEPAPTAQIPEELAALAELSGQELMSALMKYSGDSQAVIENTLLLIESGLISIDERLFEFGGNRAMSPMGMAVMFSLGNLSAEHFNRFLAAGAELHRDDMNSKFVAMVDEPEVLNTWYNRVGYGPEEHQEMLDGSLIMGNASLTNLIMQDKNGELDNLEFGEFPVNMVMAQMKSLEPVNRKELENNFSQAEPGTERIAAELLVARYQRNLDQIEVLKRYGNLDDEQRKQLEAANEDLLKSIETVNAFAAEFNG